jgi:murein DD-endopeptidase MepM/ murein hydrolase activator NlpD
MPATRLTSISLAVLLAANSGGVHALSAIVAPPRLRQGDPLLAWIVRANPQGDSSPLEATPLIATLRDASGKVAAKARCFAAQALLGEADPAKARFYGALFALPPELAPGAYRLAAADAEAGLVVEPRDFPVEVVRLNASNTKIKTVPTKRKETESDRLGAILAKIDDAALFADGTPFLFPVSGGFKSAGFGDTRRYEYSDGKKEKSFHAGIDWGVVIGTAVHACARGKVVLAVDRAVTGKTVVIEHMPGLYSMYYHLSSIEAKEGGIVERGQPIAHSGSSGVSTGPHLHWELRAKGEAVDPEYWLGVPLLDKKAAMAIINALIEGR